MTIRPLTKSRGSTAVEGALVLLLLCGIFLASLKTISIGISRMWLEHCLYSISRCALSGRDDCKILAASKINLLSWGHIEHLHIKTNFNTKKFKSAATSLVWCNSNERRPCSNKQKITLQMQMREKDLLASHSLGF